jgi:hypothetical protein
MSGETMFSNTYSNDNDDVGLKWWAVPTLIALEAHCE